MAGPHGLATRPKSNPCHAVWHAGWESEGAWIKNLEWNWKEKTKNGEEIKDDFFEGAEKLLEVRFAEGAGDLRRLGRQDLEEILTLARWFPFPFSFSSSSWSCS